MEKLQWYLVCVTVIEGRHFAVANMDSVVHVQVGDQNKMTNLQRSTDSPYYNEYFVFEMHCTLQDLIDTHVTLTIIQPRKAWRPRKILGCFNLDLSIVWSEPQHQFYHKWAVISSTSKRNKTESVGYVKMDICILTKGEVPRFPRSVSYEEDDIEKNLLLPENVAYDRPRANFVFNIYRAEGIPKVKKTLLQAFLMDNEQKPSTYIEISFGGFTEKTSVNKYNHSPVWNERIVITQLFPPLSQRILIELKFAQNDLSVKNYIYLKSISNKGENGFLPSFGPFYIYFYSSAGPEGQYCGCLLIEIYTEILNDLIWSPTCLDVLPIKMLPNLALWDIEPVLLYCTIYSATMINKKYRNKHLSFEVSIGAITDTAATVKEHGTDAFQAILDSNSHYCSIPFNGQVPCLKFISQLPDVRTNMYNVNIIEKIHSALKSEMDNIESLFEAEDYHSRKAEIYSLLLKALENLETNCRMYWKISNKKHSFTIKLEQKKFEISQREIKEIEKSAGKLIYFKSRKKIFSKMRRLLTRLGDLIETGQEVWPDIFLSMFFGTTRVSSFRIPAKKVIYSAIEEEKGLFCGAMQNVDLTSIVTENSSVSLVIQMWLGMLSDVEQCISEIPQCFRTKDMANNNVPTSLVCKEKHHFVCKAYIYEGRFVPGADKSGLADPYVVVMVNDKAMKTEAMHKTLNPVWNETLIIPDITLYGSMDYLKQNMPRMSMEVYDVDSCVSDEYIGRCFVTPELILNAADAQVTKLKWNKLHRGLFRVKGEILVSAELILVTESAVVFEKLEGVPSNLTPNKEKLRLDIYFWGIRDMKRTGLVGIRKPQIRVEVGGITIQSTVIKNASRSLNFDSPYQFVDIELPYEKEYYPSLIIKMFNCCDFGWFSFVGVCKTNVRNFVYTPMTRVQRNRSIVEGIAVSESSTSTETPVHQDELPSASKDAEPNTRNKRKFSSIFLWRHFLKPANTNVIDQNKDDSDDDDTYPDFVDWWTRFHMSLQCASDENLLCRKDIKQAHMLKIYSSELESQPEFGNFNDMLTTFEIYRGKRIGDEVLDADNVIATFKGAIRIYRWPPSDVSKVNEYVTENGLPLKDGSFQHFPKNEPITFLVRLYIIRGMNLMPKDYTGKSDPYVKITLGDKVVNDKDRYIPNQVNPVFGRCFELKGTFPFDKTVKISVWDRDLTSVDDLIGETKIDIEKRLYTKHRASCGIPYEYNDRALRTWRDQHKPSHILASLCKINGLPEPVFDENSVKIGACTFTFDKPVMREYKVKREMLSVLALHNWKDVPVVGCDLVPEHVETRSLFHPNKPGLEQGKLQMWVDLFPVEEVPAPSPVDVTPLAPQLFELRLIVWNTEDVLLEEDDFFIGEKKSDIYVKGWMVAPSQSQYTDVHYNSLNGEGNFNWRFVFTFYYLSTEDKIVMHEKSSLFSVDTTEYKVPCRITLQVWDNDVFSPDDFLGSVTMNLSRMPRGAKSSRLCTLNILEQRAPMMNLFKIKRHKGWWPFKGRNVATNDHILAGKIEAEFQLFTEEEALQHPVGKGRSEPQKLPEPHRPDISFSWLGNPWKAMKFLVFKRFRCQIITMILVVILVFMVLIAIYAFPSYAVKRLLGA